MADDKTASIVTLHQPRPKQAKTPAERARAYRQRKKTGTALTVLTPIIPVTPVPPPAGGDGAAPYPGHGPDPDHPGHETVTLRVTPPSRRPVASIVLLVAALALAIVGVTINGWFARSLGSTETAGWLFLAVGVAADLAALVMPSCAAGLWQARQWGTAAAAWAVFAMTFAFAVTAGIGFASVNIADVTASRASRVTPAVTTAQAALSDVMSARDRECAGGVGRFCRQREEAVTDRRQALDTAKHAVEQTADPQTVAAIRIVAWLSLGMLQPSGDDFAMPRLMLLALLPQVGGILLMVGRPPNSGIKVFASPS
jgi:hypothetical protein